jgi:hypothetical protein
MFIKNGRISIKLHLKTGYLFLYMFLWCVIIDLWETNFLKKALGVLYIPICFE